MPLGYFVSLKVDNPSSSAFLNMTRIFEWYGVWCDSMKGYQKDTCLKEEIALLSQNMITILGLITNRIGGG